MACHHADLRHLSKRTQSDQVLRCSDCSVQGADLWICMHEDCSYIGCTATDNNHGFIHYDDYPTHCVHVCVSNKNIRCYECGSEFIGNPPSLSESSYNHNQMGNFGVLAGGLKGAGDKMHTMNVLGLERGPGLNVSGAGDSQDSSDADDEDSLENNFDGKPRGLVGLQNIGNTCYMNSAIQALSNTPPLTQYFLDCSAAVDFLSDNKQPGLSRSYQKLVREIWNKKARGYVVPNNILYGIRNVHPMFRGYHQHDTQEFLRCFMDQLHEELKEPVREEKNRKNKQLKTGYITRQPLQNNCFIQSASDSGRSTDTSNMHYSKGNESNSDRGKATNYIQRSPARSYDNIPLMAGNRCRVYTESENLGNGSEFFPRHHRSASYCDPRGYSQIPQDFKGESFSSSSRPCSPMEVMDQESSDKEFEEEDENYETCDSGGSDCVSLNGEDTCTAQSNGGFKRKSELESVERQESENDSSTSSATKFRSVISDVFDGRLLSSVQCLTCDRVSTRVETFQDLSLPIPSRDHVAVLHNGNTPTTNGNGVGPNSSPSSGGRNAACSDAVYSAASSQEGWVWWLLGWIRSWLYGPAVTLHDCLAAFFSADELKGDNMYSCEKCNKLRNGVKYSKVLGLPEVLCVHLKRFRHELMSSTKIGAKVSFPLTGLDMRPYLHKDCTSTVSTYDLVAVICHAGTAGGGHYTCVARNRHAARWFEFDDQCVTGLTPEQVAACEAYVLFYKKTNPRMAELRQRAIELIESSNELNDIKFYVSKQWFNRFNTYAEPGPIDNHDFLCPHGGVSPERISIVERLTAVVSQSLWEFLYDNFGGGPACNHLHSCVICRLEIEKLQRRQRLEFQHFNILHQNFLEQEALSSIYAISMNWFRMWQAFVHNKTQQPPPPVDNSGIIMKSSQDNKTSPSIAIKPDSDYAQLNEELWRFFLEIYGGGPEVKLKSAPTIQIPDRSASPYAHSTGKSSNYSSSVEHNTPSIVLSSQYKKPSDVSNSEKAKEVVNNEKHYKKSLSNADLFSVANKYESAITSPSVKSTLSLQDVSMKNNRSLEPQNRIVNKDAKKVIKVNDNGGDFVSGKISNGPEFEFCNGQVSGKVRDVSSDDSEYQISKNKLKKAGIRRTRRVSEKLRNSLSADNSTEVYHSDKKNHSGTEGDGDQFENKSCEVMNSVQINGTLHDSPSELHQEVQVKKQSKQNLTKSGSGESKRSNRKSRKSQATGKKNNSVTSQSQPEPGTVNGGEKIAK